MQNTRKKTKRHPNIQPPSGFEFRIPKGHTRIVISVRQPHGSVDKDEALDLLRNRPHVKKVFDKIEYRGVTALYHVFSYKAS